MTDGPLSDIRVLELGTLVAGPFCGQLLGDFGAEVIKVEDPGSGDPMRSWGQVKAEGLSLWWPVIARNKKSITCNLRTSDGQELLRSLAARADIVVENFRPGTLERWGLGYDELASANPGLILVRSSGYGQDGPYASRAGFGSIGEAMGGLRYVTGEPDRPPSRAGISIGDSLGGIFAALGAVIALHARKRTGQGQVVDSAIYEAVLAMMEALVPEWAVGGHQRERSGAILPNIAPSNLYPTSDGSDTLIAANRDTVFERLCKVMGQPELASDERYATHDARGQRQEELDGLVGEWTAEQPSDRLLEELHHAGVPAGRIYRVSDMLSDPHFAARQAIVRLVHPELGDFPMQNVVPRLSATPGEVRHLGPELGEHNDAIYRGLLGLTDEEIDDLRRRGVI